jgi:uncharacterized protein
MQCFLVSDLHGKVSRYEKLLAHIEKHCPAAVFIGGDILPSSILHSFRAGENMPDFISDYMALEFGRLKARMGKRYPRIFIIMGNDDPAVEVASLVRFEKTGLWEYAHGKLIKFGEYQVMGYSFVPPTPFLLKDWERYDIDNTISALSVDPSQGFRTIAQSDTITTTIREDLMQPGVAPDAGKTICLFHSPPYKTGMDKIDMDGLSVDDHPVDVNVGSRAIREFIETRKPFITLHGHIHESSRLTGVWKEVIAETVSISAAWDGTGLALVSFDLSDPIQATRSIL